MDMEKLYEDLKDTPRLLLEVELKPLQGDRFQPTGFPDLGAAEYFAPDGTNMLLVESAQSMANRMEAVCWDESQNDLIPPLRGLPYIKVDLDGKGAFTTSIQESHRISSTYIMGKADDKKAEGFTKTFKEEIDYKDDKPVPYTEFYRALFKYDPNSLVHGVFIAKKVFGGRLRVSRMLSGFVEASGVRIAQSGGVKIDRVKPGTEKDATGESTSKKGEGNVPYSRTEYTADKITAYFNMDLAGIRGFGLDESAEKLIIVLSLYKIQKFLQEGLRLRTACDLKQGGDFKVNIAGLSVPSIEELEEELPNLIQECTDKELFAQPPVTLLNLKSEK